MREIAHKAALEKGTEMRKKQNFTSLSRHPFSVRLANEETE